MLKTLFERRRKDLLLFGSLSILILIYEIIIALTVFIFNNFPFNKPLSNPFYQLIRWDSLIYLDILKNGYTLDTAKCFPLYPILVKFISLFSGDAILAGFFVSWASLVFALFYFWKLLNISDSVETTKRALLLLLFFPSAIFFSTIYTESLFLALTIAFFYHIKKENWAIAAVLGLFAASARTVGVFLFAVMLLRYWEIFHSLPFFGKLGREKVKEKFRFLFLSLLIPLGTALYCLFCFFTLGHLFAFFSNQTTWQYRVFNWPWNVFLSFFKVIFVERAAQTHFDYFFRAVIIDGSSFLLLFAATVYFLYKKENLYAVFCGLNVLLFSTMFPMISVNRYILVAFPVYLFIARAVKKEPVFFSLLAFFIVFFTFTIYVFSRGAWAG
jgi:Gpi18-like mannosyltransferase